MFNLDLGTCSISIVIICYVIAELYKIIVYKQKKKIFRKIIPVLCAICGGIIATIIYFVSPTNLEVESGYYLDYLTKGILSGLASTGVNQIFQQLGIQNSCDE